MSTEQQEAQPAGRTSRWGARLALAGRVASFISGWGLIWWQALYVDPAHVNETFIWVAASLIMGPVGAEAVQRIRGGGGPPAPPTSPSQPA